jgi:hypothetical protein
MYQAATVCEADQFLKIVYVAVSSRIADWIGGIWLCHLLLHVFRNLHLCPRIVLEIFHNQKTICLEVKTNTLLNINDFNWFLQAAFILRGMC